MIHNYKNLLVWKKSIELVVSTYQLTKKLPASERYGLVTQLEVALQLNLASKEVIINLQDKATEISKMLHSLIKTCRI